MSLSNCYSLSENILLKWASIHSFKVEPANTQELYDFENHFADGYVFGNIIRSHVGDSSVHLSDLARPGKIRNPD